MITWLLTTLWRNGYWGGIFWLHYINIWMMLLFHCDDVGLQIFLDPGAITNQTWKSKEVVEELLFKHSISAVEFMHQFGNWLYSAHVLEYVLHPPPPPSSSFCLTPAVHALLVLVADFTVVIAAVTIGRERTVNSSVLLHLFWGQ